MLIILGVLMALAPVMPLGPPAMAERAQLVQQDPLNRVWQVLELGALMPILRQEAVHEATRMEEEGLIAGSGPSWPDFVAGIHESARMETLFREGLRDALGRGDPILIDRALEFHASGLGQRVIALESAARQAMLEEGADATAQARFEQARRQGDPRAMQILDLIQNADMVTPNVAGGLNAAIAFSRGFAEGGGFDMAPDEGQMMADAWAQRDRIEAEATGWLRGFLMLAYAPLGDAELATYAEYTASAEGQALSRLLFAGFDRVFEQTSYDMGLAAALRGQGQEL